VTRRARRSAQDLLGRSRPLGLQPVALELARQQVARAIASFSAVRVAVEGDDLHPVQQLRRDRVVMFAVARKNDLERSTSTSR